MPVTVQTQLNMFNNRSMFVMSLDVSTGKRTAYRGDERRSRRREYGMPWGRMLRRSQNRAVRAYRCALAQRDLEEVAAPYRVVGMHYV